MKKKLDPDPQPDPEPQLEGNPQLDPDPKFYHDKLTPFLAKCAK